MSQAPDIEVYIPEISTEQGSEWLTSVFNSCQLAKKKKGMPKSAQPIYVEWEGQKIFCIIFEQVVPGYTSIWLDSPNLPWSSDQECALAAATYFSKPVRFVADSWQQKQDPDAWSEVDESKNVTQLIWKT